MEDLPDDRTLILNLIKGVAPERADEIEALWAKYQPAVEFVAQKPQAVMNADKTRIQFDVKLIDVFWVLGHAAWQAIEIYSPLVVLAPFLDLELDVMIKADARFTQGERDFKETMSVAHTFVEGTVDPDRWPDTIPKPDADRRKLPDPVSQAIYDLVLMALGFAWLHELRHVMLMQDKMTPNSRPDEEIACDVWARGFVLDQLATYASRSGADYHAVYTKRALAMSLAVLIIQLLTPDFAQFGSLHYPAFGERMQAIIGETAHKDDSVFWTATACILIAMGRYKRMPLNIKAQSRRDLVRVLIEAFRASVA